MNKKITFLTLIFLSLFVLFFSYLNAPDLAFSAEQPCYKCENNKFVCYKGGDTIPKRKEAQDKFKCKVLSPASCNPAQCNGRNLD